jgi:capsular polysaccharide transport system permease protein
MDLAVLDQKPPLTLVEAKAKTDAIARALRRAARQAQMPAPLISGGAGIRARKGQRAFRLGVFASFILMVLCPFLAASVYWGLIASKQYATEAKFALRSAESSGTSALSGFAGLGVSGQAQDAQILVESIRSRRIVEAIDRDLGFSRVYGGGEIDTLSRLKPGEPVEELEKYWRKRVDVNLESTSGIITLNVRAFTPQDSVAIARKVIELSEALVNDISTRSRKDSFNQAQAELTRSEKNLKRATEAMRDARNAEGVLDAGAAAEALNKLVTMLRLQLSQAESDLAAQGAEAAHDSPQAHVFHSRIASLKEQIAEYSHKIAGGDGENMAARLGALSSFQIDLDLARQQYAQAAAIFEATRVDLDTQHDYLVSFLPPTLAEKSTYPQRWWQWSIVVLPALLIWSFLVGLAFVARDHMAK